MFSVSLWASGLLIIMFTFQLPSLGSWNHYPFCFWELCQFGCDLLCVRIYSGYCFDNEFNSSETSGGLIESCACKLYCSTLHIT